MAASLATNSSAQPNLHTCNQLIGHFVPHNLSSAFEALFSPGSDECIQTLTTLDSFVASRPPCLFLLRRGKAGRTVAHIALLIGNGGGPEIPRTPPAESLAGTFAGESGR